MSSCRLPSACRISVIYCFYELSAHRLLHAAWIFLAFLKDWMLFQSNFYQNTDMTQYSMIPPGKSMWTFFDVSARSQNPCKNTKRRTLCGWVHHYLNLQGHQQRPVLKALSPVTTFNSYSHPQVPYPHIQNPRPHPQGSLPHPRIIKFKS